MAQPASARDRKLIKAAVDARSTNHVASKVGATDQQQQNHSDAEVDSTLWSLSCSGQPDEDFLLSRPIPTPLLSLPCLLLGCRRPVVNNNAYMEECVMQRRQLAVLNACRDVIDLVISHEARAKVHCMSFERLKQLPIDCTAGDAKLLLDYIPILRICAVHERAALSVEVVDDGSSGLARRRTTRKSAKRGRPHFFESLNLVIPWGEGIPSAVQAGETLALQVLQYEQ
jgi:hypothetical protein